MPSDLTTVKADENPLKITKLVLKRFRSVASETIDFANPLFLIGKNGAGKTNIVDAFAFISEAMDQSLQSILDKRGGISAVRHRVGRPSYPPNLGMRINFSSLGGVGASGHYAFEIKALPDYGFKIVREQCVVNRVDEPGLFASELPTKKGIFFDRDEETFQSSLDSTFPKFDPQSLALPLIGRTRLFSMVTRLLSSMRTYSIDPSQVRDFQEPDVGTRLNSNGSNVASVLQYMRLKKKDDFVRLCEILSSIVPGAKSVIPVKHGRKLTLEFMQQWGVGTKRPKTVKFEAFAMSDGTLRALGLLVAILQSPPPTLIALEEPESTIHPEALGSILDVIRIAAKQTQIVVTTHSSDLLDAKWLKPENLRVVLWSEGATQVRPLDSAAVNTLRDHLMGAGELLRANALRADNSSRTQGKLFDELE